MPIGLAAAACRNEPALQSNDHNQPGSGLEGTRGSYVPVDTYDPARDPEVDVQRAIVEARRTGKRILLELGGDWCVWCHIMDAYFEQQPALLAARERSFITVKINVSEENDNKQFLAQYPKIPGYPHIFVLDSDGKLLHSQDTADLESGKSYDLDRFSAFLTKWGPPSLS
jgi:hypothetical protein